MVPFLELRRPRLWTVKWQVWTHSPGAVPWDSRVPSTVPAFSKLLEEEAASVRERPETSESFSLS